MTTEGTPASAQATEPDQPSASPNPAPKDSRKALLELGRNFSLAALLSSVPPYLAYSHIFFLDLWAVILLAFIGIVLSNIWVVISVTHFFRESNFPTTTRKENAKALTILVLLLLFGSLMNAGVSVAAKNARFAEYCRSAWADPSDPYNQNKQCRRMRADETERRTRMLRAF